MTERLIDSSIKTSKSVPAAGGAEEKLTFRVLGDFAQLEAIEHDWRSLERKVANGNNIFQTYSWCWHWADKFAKNVDAGWSIKLITGWRKDQLVLLWPLAVHRHGPVKIARWLGDPLTQYGDVLVLNEPGRNSWLKKSWKLLLAQKDIDLALLHFVREDAAAAMQIGNCAIDLKNDEDAVAIDLRPYKNWDKLNETYKRSHRRNRNRRRKHLRELGVLRFEMLSSGSNAQQALANALRLKETWLESHGLMNSTFKVENIVATLKAMTSGQEPSVDCLVSILHLNDEPIAYEIGFASFGSYCAHIGAFDHRFARHSPGKLLMEDTISNLIDKEFDTYDLMTPSSDYKLEWTDSSMRVRDFAIPLNKRGAIYVHGYLRFARPGIKFLWEKMPTQLRRVVKTLREGKN